MIIDSSALVAILREESEAAQFVAIMLSREPVRISAAGYLETGIVIDGGRNPASSRRVDSFMADAGISVEPVTPEQARVARVAYQDFGKGSGHPAQLNFGDCFAYALARHKGEPLLFKGADFTHTGIASALA